MRERCTGLGRQLNFYAGPRDTEALAQELRKKGAVIIGRRSPKSEPVVADSKLPLLSSFFIDEMIWPRTSASSVTKSSATRHLQI
jgi:hypothetical protein